MWQVRSLRADHEQRLRQQADMVKKLAAQEALHASLSSQLSDTENQVGTGAARGGRRGGFVYGLRFRG
jgi:hypothetical protein